MRPIQEIIDTVMQAVQQEGGFGFIPKLAQPFLEAVINFAKKNLSRSAQSHAPTWAQQDFKTKPKIDDHLLMEDKDDNLDIPEPDLEYNPRPSKP